MSSIEVLFVEIPDGTFNRIFFDNFEVPDADIHPQRMCADGVPRNLVEVSPARLIELLRNQVFLKTIITVFGMDARGDILLLVSVRLAKEVQQMLEVPGNIKQISIDPASTASFLSEFVAKPAQATLQQSELFPRKKKSQKPPRRIESTRARL